MSELIDIVLYQPQIVVAILVGIAAFATIITLGLPLLEGDKLGARMKHVATERDVLRARHLERLQQEKNRGRLRPTPKVYMQQIVQQLNLQKLLESEDTKDKLRMAGLRGQAPLVTYLFMRAAMPLVFMAVSAFYVYGINDFGLVPLMRLVVVLGCGYLGFYGPVIFIQNLISRRQQSIKRAFPDALDLLLICVESGMSIEAAFNKVAQEVGAQSIEMAEEMSLTTAELSYLQERRQAYENLAKRTGLPGVRGVCTSLIQAERYGTPLGNALRVLAQENRDMRMAEAERKAAGLPPKLTVPMIVFFLPVLFVVILGPAVIRYMNM